MTTCQFPKCTAHYYQYPHHYFIGFIWYCLVLNLLVLLFWSRSVAPINSSNVSVATPSLDLPDVADLFAPPADNASRKRESNGSALHDARSKIPRMQSQHGGIRSAAGNALIPPQLRGRLVFNSFHVPFGVIWDHLIICILSPPQLTNRMRFVGSVPVCICQLFTLCILYP